MLQTICFTFALTLAVPAWASFGGGGPGGFLFYCVLLVGYVWGAILSFVLLMGLARRRAVLWLISALNAFQLALLALVHRHAAWAFNDLRVTCIPDAWDVAAILALATVPLLFLAPVLQHRRRHEPALSRRPAYLLLCGLALVPVGPFVWSNVPGTGRYVLGHTAEGQLTLVRGRSLCQVLGAGLARRRSSILRCPPGGGVAGLQVALA